MVYFTRRLAKRLKTNHDIRASMSFDFYDGFDGIYIDVGDNMYNYLADALEDEMIEEWMTTMEKMSLTYTFDGNVVRKMHPAIFWGNLEGAEGMMSLWKERSDREKITFIYRNVSRDPLGILAKLV